MPKWPSLISLCCDLHLYCPGLQPTLLWGLYPCYFIIVSALTFVTAETLFSRSSMVTITTSPILASSSTLILFLPAPPLLPAPWPQFPLALLWSPAHVPLPLYPELLTSPKIFSQFSGWLSGAASYSDMYAVHHFAFCYIICSSTILNNTS